MTPEERDVFVAKLKEEKQKRLKARKHGYYEKWKARHPNSWQEKRANGYRANKRTVKNWQLKTAYGITLEEKEAMIAKQNNRCAICGTDTPSKKGWHVDHCHSSKKVRELLCHHCNQMLSNARDDVSILLRGIYYLDRHNLTSGGNNHGNEGAPGVRKHV